jgi:hypothetical protein
LSKVSNSSKNKDIKMTKNKNARITTVTTEELAKRIKELADDQQRSVSKMVEIILMETIRKIDNNSGLKK